MSLKAEDLVLCSCCALEPTSAHREQLRRACHNGGLDWDLIFRTSLEHKISPLVFSNLRKYSASNDLLPTDVAARFALTSRQSSARNLMTIQGILSVAEFFRERSHDILLLKHASYSYAHKPLFDMTMSADIDLVSRPTSEAGQPGTPYLWSANSETDATWEIIDQAMASTDPRLKLLNLEIDNRLHHDVVWNGVIPIDFRTVWNDSIAVPLGSQIVYVPHIHDLIIISAINTYRKPLIRLRNLLEMYELTRSDANLNWHELNRKARAYQCSSLLYSALHATRAVLGGEVTDAKLAMLRPAAIRRMAIERINRQISFSSACRTATLWGRISGMQNRVTDFARRLLALDLRQIGRFFWLRIFLRRVARVIKY